MYKSLNSYDELRGIFSSKVGTQQITMDALQAEMRTDYKAALKLYTEVSVQCKIIQINQALLEMNSWAPT